MEEKYKVYVQTDSSGRIIGMNSSAFVSDTTGWTKIDEGGGDRYHHAQGNYLPLSLLTEQGVCRYKLVNGKPVERSAAEIAADLPSATVQPSEGERIAALESAMLALMEVPSV